MDEVQEILTALRAQASARNREGMARYGINVARALGVSVTEIRRMARPYRKRHDLARQLWETQVHEARIMACIIGEPEKVTKAEMERWVKDLDSWDICDLACGNLWDKTPWAYEKALAWNRRRAEFVKRAGFALMAALSVHDKQANDDAFSPFFDAVVAQCEDERNFVKKAVNWALRQMGKRNLHLHGRALAIAQDLCERQSKAARWIGRDAVRELTNPKVIARARKGKSVSRT